MPAISPLNGFRAFIAVFSVLLGVGGCASSEHDRASRVNVYAATSTSDVVAEIVASFTEQTGIEIVCNFASSSTLAQQIQAGAPADVFISAHMLWMDELEAGGFVQPQSRVDLLGNSLVLIAPRERPMKFDFRSEYSLADAVRGRIALGDPAHVPAGRYAKQALQNLGWWIELEPRIVGAGDVRAAVRFVQQQAVDAGIVYATDAQASFDVVVVDSIPTSLHDPIVYPAALVSDAGDAAAEFLRFLQGDDAAAIFEEAGFVVLH